MTTVAGKSNELVMRVITGTLLAVLCLAALWYDGWRLLALASALSALMVWELFHLAARDRHLYAAFVAVLTAAAVWFSGRDQMVFAVGLLFGVVIIGWILAPAAWRVIFPLYVFGIAAAGLAIFLLRDTYGFWLTLWLILVVVVSDVAGYFVGRAVGGAKFWPTVSPNKTWSGTIAGWVGGAIVGAIMAPHIVGEMGEAGVIMLSVVFALAAQLGDIFESWVKRRAGVKDSSHILPGHGGVLDRFDGMVAVLLLALFLSSLLFVPLY